MSPDPSPPRRSMVVCSLEPWGEVRRRIQLLVRLLVEDDPALTVLYVEPPVDVPRALRHRRFSELRSDRGSDMAGIHVMRPRKWLPRLVGPSVDRSLVGQVIRAAGRLGLKDPFLWVNDAHYAGLLARTQWPSIYDVTDDWLLASLSPRARARLTADERILLSDAGAVVVCSPDLAHTRGATRAVDIIPNAVDVERFRTPTTRPDDLPPAPVALYVGTLHEDRLDVDLCCQLAVALPEVQLVLLGPNSLAPEYSEALGSLANVHLPGARPYDRIPAYLQHADVIVIPHKVTPFTESLDPIKAYECLAAGRITVATAVAGFRDLGPPVVVAGPETFVAEVRRALAAPPGATSVPVDVPTWRDRAGALSAVMDRVLAQSDARP
ncbi:MAG TPA: glycosyltransferase [Acidimicrobiales bacterium]|jgi:teichuronic acid biosynthesis glycosyltransferase TuaH